MIIREISRGHTVLERCKREQYGFISEPSLAAIAADPHTRLTPVLVRCGNGRFVAAAQDAAHFIKAIEASGQDYVRDVSLPAA